ncbi:hypothetical protein [Pseudomonas fildesensis]|uniref:hypothetical protein n=1 Tax=Pseudomonas fildesensis TaxID=1674920 RepID=UPI00128BEB8F|nr:hypothetical protein [Pseudomonas fildesensis]
MKNLDVLMCFGYQSSSPTKMPALFYAEQVTNSYGWEMAMANEHKQRDEPERAQPGQRHEEEKPQTWKHPDDGTELSERDQERPLKP